MLDFRVFPALLVKQILNQCLLSLAESYNSIGTARGMRIAQT